MRRLTLTILALALMALLAGTTLAQPGFGIFGGGNPAGLINNKGVQEELKLTDEQKEKATKIRMDMFAKMQDVFQSAAGDQDKLRAEMRKVNDTFAKTITELLKPDQAKRFKQIELQVLGLNALTREDVQKELKLTDKQKSAVTDALQAMRQSIQDLGQPNFQDQEEMRKRQEKIQALNKEHLAKVAKSFTDDQKKTWTEMLGKPFDYKPEPFRPGGN
jgi:Spy/CpxP family protein refolding chaperone